jgi:hypothetical protein
MSDQLDAGALLGLYLQLPRHDRLTTDHARLPAAFAGPAFAVLRALHVMPDQMEFEIQRGTVDSLTHDERGPDQAE